MKSVLSVSCGRSTPNFKTIPPSQALISWGEPGDEANKAHLFYESLSRHVMIVCPLPSLAGSELVILIGCSSVLPCPSRAEAP